MNKTHYRSNSNQMKNSSSLLSLVNPILNEENSYNKVKKALDCNKTKIRNQDKLYLENKKLNNFNIHHHEVLEKNNTIKEENNLFSQTYQKIQKFQKEKNKTKHRSMDASDIVFKDLLNVYKERGYKISDLSYKHNIFKQDPLLIGSQSFYNYYKNKKIIPNKKDRDLLYLMKSKSCAYNKDLAFRYKTSYEEPIIINKALDDIINENKQLLEENEKKRQTLTELRDNEKPVSNFLLHMRDKAKNNSVIRSTMYSQSTNLNMSEVTYSPIKSSKFDYNLSPKKPVTSIGSFASNAINTKESRNKNESIFTKQQGMHKKYPSDILLKGFTHRPKKSEIKLMKSPSVAINQPTRKKTFKREKVIKIKLTKKRFYDERFDYLEKLHDAIKNIGSDLTPIYDLFKIYYEKFLKNTTIIDEIVKYKYEPEMPLRKIIQIKEIIDKFNLPSIYTRWNDNIGQDDYALLDEIKKLDSVINKLDEEFLKYIIR
jgi:hypothetical protein